MKRAHHGSMERPASNQEARQALSRWTKGIAWAGVLAAGAFSFIAARSLPGHAASAGTPPSGSTNVPGTAGTQAGTAGSQAGSSLGQVAGLQPSAQLPVNSGSQPFVRSGGS